MNIEQYNRQSGNWDGINNYRCHYSSSLFPYFFTVQHLAAKTGIAGNNPLEIKVNNDGSDDDEYKIEVADNGLVNKYIAYMKLPAHSSLTRKIILIKKKNADAKTTGRQPFITISSISNPSMIRTIPYPEK